MRNPKTVTVNTLAIVYQLGSSINSLQRWVVKRLCAIRKSVAGEAARRRNPTVTCPTIWPIEISTGQIGDLKDSLRIQWQRSNRRSGQRLQSFFWRCGFDGSRVSERSTVSFSTKLRPRNSQHSSQAGREDSNEHVVQRVAADGDAEASQQVHRRKEAAGGDSEGEAEQRERFTSRPDVMRD